MASMEVKTKHQEITDISLEVPYGVYHKLEQMANFLALPVKKFIIGVLKKEIENTERDPLNFISWMEPEDLAKIIFRD